ncbi:MAG TPA: acyltransferase [Sphingomonadaceae bacterium]|nr:acyltransferase [Sphingomonadaceae bacterium]
MAGRDRFATIDALRGLAAISVTLFHVGPTSALPMPGGYLAVDLFFALSGFVIAHSYTPRFKDGMGLRDFLQRRVIRLYPMLFVGALLGIVLHGGAASMIFLVPEFRSSQLYPTNPPFWSLLMELMVNVAFALVVLRLTRGWMALAMAVSAAVLAAGLASGQPLFEVGVNWSSFHLALARTVFSFTAGVAIHALWQRHGCPSRTTRLALLPLLAATLVFALVPQNSNLAGMTAVLLFVPLATWLAVCWELPWRGPAQALGDLSYPLYCIHVPIIALARDEGWITMGLCLAVVAAAWALDRYVDRPARRLVGWAMAQNARMRLAPGRTLNS